MSNASNLSTLANVLDDGSDGQFLKSTGSGGVAFDTVAAGAVVYATADLLPLSGNSAGDMAYVTATNRFYINNGSGWYSVSLVNTNPNITSVQDASSNTTPFTLATDGTATVITVTAADPEEVPLTYGYSVTSGSLNGSTVTQGTGSNTNVFTVTPHASQDATFTLTFTASDGINQATSANAFSLSFVTIVADSNHTTLLATATGTSDNNNITDSSSNNHSITVNGDAHAGTFSPYRSGGYSTYFDGNGDYLQNNDGTGAGEVGSGAFCIEAWVYKLSNSSFDSICSLGTGENSYQFEAGEAADYVRWETNQGAVLTSTTTLNLNQWYHVAVSRDSSNNIRLYVDGTKEDQTTNTEDYSDAGPFEIARNRGSTDEFEGYIRDLRIVVGDPVYTNDTITVPTAPLTAITNTNLLACHLPYIADGSTNNWALNVNGDNVSTKPFSPYDYSEYSATDHGGSLYFNGTNSAVQIADNDDFDFGTGDLTIECWVYPEVTSNSYPGFLGTSAGWGSVAASGFRFDNLGDSKFQMSWYGPGDPFLETQSTYKHNQWYHFVVTRTGGSTWRMFVNGILEDTGTNSTAYDISIGGNNLQVGGKTWDGGNGWFKGNVADLRLTKGSVVSEYQTTSTTVGTKIFTPRTSPISSSGSELHLKGTDASIIDKSQGANLKLVGDTTGSTTQVKFSNTKSMYFDAEGDYIDISEGFIPLGTSDFTIETWFYPTANPTSHEGIFSNGTHNSGNWLGLLYNSSRKIRYDIAGSTNNISTTTLSLNNWYHIMLCRFGGNIRLYIDGVHEHSRTDSSDLNYETARIGSRIGLSNYELNSAYLQDFRITKGLVRHVDTQNPTTSFTPPSAPLEG